MRCIEAGKQTVSQAASLIISIMEHIRMLLLPLLPPAFELVPFEAMTRSLHKQIFLETTASVGRAQPTPRPTTTPTSLGSHPSKHPSIHLPGAVVADVAAVMTTLESGLRLGQGLGLGDRRLATGHALVRCCCCWWKPPHVADRLCQVELISR